VSTILIFSLKRTATDEYISI